MKKIIFFVFLLLAIPAFLYAIRPQPVSAGNGWSVCISTDSQCGTDNGTQEETVMTDFIGICPEGYEYQNNGNYNQGCHRVESCGDNDNDNDDTDCPEEHVAPTGTVCPQGYTKSEDGKDTVCSKEISQSCHTGKIDFSACTPAQECPTACGHEASDVSNGEGGFTDCKATPACEVDQCINLSGIQEKVPPNMQTNEDHFCSCLKGFHEVFIGDQKQDFTCQPDPTVTPNEPTPTPQQTTSNGGSGGGTPDAPSCTTPNTNSLPANVFVVRNGTEVTVNGFITQGDSANIYWRESSQAPSWPYSSAGTDPNGVKPNGDGFVSYHIGSLKKGVDYDFGFQQKWGCGSGEIWVKAIIHDSDTKGTIWRITSWEVSN